VTTVVKQQSLDRRRAAFAYAVVSGLRQQEDKKLKEEYTTLAQNLPTMILQNGLGQTAAFLMSKAKGDDGCADGRLLDHLARWLFDETDKKKPEERRPFLRDVGATGTERLMAALLKAERHEWTRAQHEAVEVSTWLKRFAEALIPKLDSQSREKEGGSHGQ
jgi:CRISPR-associated protein Cmr5